MDIAALSMGLSQMKLQNEVSTSVMKMAMDTQGGGLEKLMDSAAKTMEQSVNPHIGGNIDIQL